MSCRAGGWWKEPLAGQDDALETARARLRTTHRCFRGHDPHRSRVPAYQANGTLKRFLKRTLSAQKVELA